MKQKISVAIATFNEEENIGPCLDTVKDWVDEMIVVDGSSQDKTREIAKEYGAKVIKTTNKPIFHINKQMAIDEASGEWIFQLDADERVTPKLRDEILKIIKSKTEFNSSAARRIPKESPPLPTKVGSSAATNEESPSLRAGGGFNGFWIPRKNFFLGRYLKKGGQYPDYTLRLYKKGKGRLPCKSVHEQAEVEGKVGYLKNDLLHLADPTFSRYLVRFGRYTSLIADELEEKKVKLNFPNLLNYLFIKPLWWFLLTFFRHKGFVDGFQGFVFSLFSGMRFPVGYIKYWERKHASQKS